MQNIKERIMAGTAARNAKQREIAELRKTILQDRKRLSSHKRKLKRLEDSLLPSSHNIEPEPLDFDGVVDKKEIDVIKVIAQRMREARQISAHTHTQAAKLLGISFDDLKRIENAVGIYRIPFWLVRRAAETYSVPVDFLLGVISNWDAADGEVFLSRNHLAALQRQQLENFAKTATEQIQQDNRLAALNSAVAASAMAVQQIIETFTHFTQTNPGFENMAGGAPVLRQVQIAEELTAHAAGLLAKYRCLPESLKAHGEYMLKTFPDKNGYFP